VERDSSLVAHELCRGGHRAALPPPGGCTGPCNTPAAYPCRGVACSLSPSALTTLSTVASSGLPSGESAL
jgi:hypothetical protein